CRAARRCMCHRRHWLQCVVGVVVAITLAGCMPATRAPVAPPTAVDVRTEGFQAGVRATLESYATQYLDNDFPYYDWHAPLGQQTWIPSQISGGVLIPGHLDYVTITPGAYKRAFAAPLTSQRPLMDQRPYVREHPLGWAEPAPTTPRIGAPVSSRASPPAA